MYDGLMAHYFISLTPGWWSLEPSPIGPSWTQANHCELLCFFFKRCKPFYTAILLGWEFCLFLYHFIVPQYTTYLNLPTRLSILASTPDLINKSIVNSRSSSCPRAKKQKLTISHTQAIYRFLFTRIDPQLIIYLFTLYIIIRRPIDYN